VVKQAKEQCHGGPIHLLMQAKAALTRVTENGLSAAEWSEAHGLTDAIKLDLARIVPGSQHAPRAKVSG
jgi:hypothetical protein